MKLLDLLNNRVRFVQEIPGQIVSFHQDLIMVKVWVDPLLTKEDFMAAWVNFYIEADSAEEMDLFDGVEHSYIEIGAFLGDQGTALKLMAAGTQLGVWNLLSPLTMLPFLDPSNPDDAVLMMKMAGRGFVGIQCPPGDDSQDKAQNNRPS